MKRYFLILPASALILSGCGSMKRTSAFTDNQTVDNNNRNEKIILYPTGAKRTVDYSAAASETVDAFNMGAFDLAALDAISFKDAETAHVRLTSYDPIPASGTLSIPLDELRRNFCYPYKGKFISDYGMRGSSMHTGVDIKAIPNDTIRAAFPGVVRLSKLYSGYGNVIVIRHPEGFETVYSHNSKNLVKPNDKVLAGTPIGLAGRTGRATTEHLHFELRVSGQPVDPKTILDMEKMDLREGTVNFQKRKDVIVAYNTPDELRKIEQQEVAREKAREFTENRQAEVRTNTPVSSAASNSGSTQYHTIVKGDTLYGLSRKYSTTVKELCRLNDITEKTVLQLGRKLRVK